MLPAVKAAHTGMAAPAPAAASDLTEIEGMQRPELEAALTARGISFEPKRWLKTLRKMLAEAQGGAAAAAARPAGGSAPSSAANALKQAFPQAGRTVVRPEDITANVRAILNGGEGAEPSCSSATAGDPRPCMLASLPPTNEQILPFFTYTAALSALMPASYITPPAAGNPGFSSTKRRGAGPRAVPETN